DRLRRRCGRRGQRPEGGDGFHGFRLKPLAALATEARAQRALPSTGVAVDPFRVYVRWRRRGVFRRGWWQYRLGGRRERCAAEVACRRVRPRSGATLGTTTGTA